MARRYIYLDQKRTVTLCCVSYLTCLIFHHLHLHSQKPLDQTRPVLPQTPNCGCVARRHMVEEDFCTLYYMLYYSRQILLKLAAAKIEVELNITCVLVLMWFHQKLYLHYTSSAKRAEIWLVGNLAARAGSNKSIYSVSLGNIIISISIIIINT